MTDSIINKLNLCHQIPERSFNFKGRQFPVCARCTGILLGYCTLPLFYFGIIKIPLLFIILFNIPLLIDSITQYYGLRESNNKLRLITGFLTGFALSALILIVVKVILFNF
jgi:uncharacterized membrane protein